MYTKLSYVHTVTSTSKSSAVVSLLLLSRNSGQLFTASEFGGADCDGSRPGRGVPLPLTGLLLKKSNQVTIFQKPHYLVYVSLYPCYGDISQIPEQQLNVFRLTVFD